MKFNFKLLSGSGTEEKMKKRVLSILLCLMMVLGLAPVSIFAETAVSAHKHCICGKTSCTKTSGGHTSVEWTAWSNYLKLPTEAGNYYLVYDVKISYTWECESDINLCLNGKTITCTSGSGIDDYDTIKVAEGKSLTVTDCQKTVGKITHAEGRGGSGIENRGTFTLWKGSITGNGLTKKNNDHPTGVYNNGGTFNMNGGSITGNAALWQDNDSLLRINNGGGVYNSGTFNMTAGTISDNTGNYGGGVYNCGGTFNMSGGTITGNTGCCGGGVANTSVVFTMTGGKIIGNTAKYNGGGVWNGSTFSISGNVKITGNRKGGTFENGILTGGENDNVNVVNESGRNCPIKSEGLKSGASVGINGNENQTIVTGTTSTDGFFSDNTAYELVSNENNGLKLVPALVHNSHCICGDSDCTDTWHGGAPAWTAISSLNEITKAGSYYLKQAVTLNGTWVCKYNGVNLCLNGMTITVANNADAIEISKGASLTVTDCSETAGRITHNSGKTGRGINNGNGGTFTLWGGSVTGNSIASDSGGGVYNYNGTFNMYGGSITGNNAGNLGGGVHTYGTFNMTGGEIKNNKAGTCGGGVFNNKIFTMTGGSITGNNAAKHGGGVYVFGTFNMYGGSITGNNAVYYGGGVYNSANSKLCMSGAPIITGNRKGGTFGTDGKLTGGTDNNVYLVDTAITVIDGGMGDNASIGISGSVGNTVLTGTTSTNGFFSDDTDYYLKTDENGGIKLSNDITVSGKLLVKNGGGEIADGKKAYDGKSVVFADVAVKAGSKTIEDASYTYIWQKKNAYGTYADLTDLTGSVGPAEAGDYRLTVTAVKGDEELASAVYTFTVERVTLTVSAAAQDKKYDGNADAYVKAELDKSGVIGNDEITLVTSGVTASFDTKNFGTNKPVTLLGSFTLSGAAAGNYMLVWPENLTASISKKTLTVENLAVANKTYDGTYKAAISGTPTLRGVVSGEDVALVNGTPSFTGAAAGKNISVSFTEFSLSGADIGNYTLIQPTGITADIDTYISDKSEYNVNSNDWLNTDFTVTAKNGWQISYTDTADGEWVNTLTVSQENNNGTLRFYVRNKASGVISEVITESYKIDKTVPTGEIRIDERNRWQEFLNRITFKLFFKNEQTVTVTANDSGSGVKTTEYLLTADDLSIDELADKAFSAYKAPFGLKPDKKLIVYVRITDTAGNVNYLRSDGIVLDATAPVINGADNGKTYCGSVTLTFTDDNRVTVTLNGNTAALTNGKLTIAPAAGEQTVSATDEAGNCTTIKVTVNGSHTWGDWTSNGNNTHSRTCAVDGAHTETADCHGGNATCKTKAICDDCRAPYGSYGVHYWDTSAWGYKGADGHAHTCKTDGCTAHSTLIAHIKSLDEATENDPVICSECGYVITSALGHICANHLTPVEAKAATCTETGNKAYYVCSCGKLYADATASIEITDRSSVIENALGHDWAAATCTEPKTCKRDGCNAVDGSPLGHNYSAEWSKDKTNHWHTCQNKDCTEKADLAQHNPGAAATETEGQICTECGYVITPALGHICANHLTPVEAKAATCTETGNTAYYKCSCGKLYADATASVEITEAQTVLARHDHDYEWKIDKEATADENGSKHEECKLCHDKKAAVVIPAIGKTDSGTDKTSPKTGESNMVGLWVALLFVSGAGVAGATVYKKRKRSVK